MSAACANCGSVLTGRFCASCGQDARLRLTFTELMGQAIGGLFSLDSRFWRTLRDLAIPGRISAEYLAGRRVRYMPPVQSYLFASLLFFAVLVPGMNATLTDSGFRAAASAEAASSGVTLEVYLAKVDAMQPGWPAERERWRRATATASLLMFALLPLFALVLWGFHLSSDRYYLEHLVFALHLQTFGFMVLSALFAVEAMLFVWWWPALPRVIWPLTLTLFALYAIAALRRVQGESWPVTAFKFVSATGVYIALLVGVMRASYELSGRA